MNKFQTLLVTAVITVISAGSCVYADSFTPLDFSGATYNSETTNTNTIAAAQPAETTPVSPVVSDNVGNKNMQSAISQLDNAQVEVRNDLMKYKTKYAEVDAKYNAIKQERSELAREVRIREKKIRQLDNAKEKIRRNME